MSNIESESIETLRAERDRLRDQLADRERQLARTEEDLRRAIAESYALYLTSLDITGQLDLLSTLSSILRRAMSVIYAECGLVALLDNTSGDLIISAELNINADIVGTRLRPGEGLTGEVLLTGRSLALENYQTWPNRLERLNEYHFFASASLPLRWQGKVIGVLTLFHNQPDVVFSLDDLDSLQHVTVQAAIAIHNAQLYAEEKARNHQLAMLYQASTRITSSLDREAVLRTSAESLMDALDVRACIIYEHNDSASLTVLADYVRSADDYLVQHTETVTLPDHVQRAVETGYWIVLQRNDPLLFPGMAAYMDRRGAQSILLVPIMLGQRAIGLIELGALDETRRFSPADIDTARALAAHIGIAVRHAQLHYQLQVQRVNEQAILLKLTRRLLETTEQQQVAEQAVQAVAEALQVSLVDVRLADGDLLISRASYGWDRAEIERESRQQGNVSGIDYAALMGGQVVVEDAASETRFVVNALWHEQGVRSAVITLMIYGEKVIGALCVCSDKPGRFDADDARLLSLLAYQTTVALERARLFESVQAYADMLEVRIDDRIREIRSEQKRTDAILQATGEALIVFDPGGYIQRVNRAFEVQYGNPASKVLGKHCTDVFGLDFYNQAPYPGAAPDVQGVWRGDFQMPRFDGHTYDAAVTVSRVIDPAGKTSAIVASVRDISYLKELDRMKNKFVSNVSHELRTPLANMKLYTHLLVNGFEARRDQYLAILQRETGRLQQLIEDLLLLSRLDLDSVEPIMREVDVNQVVGNLVEDRKALAQSHNLDLSSTLHPGVLMTMADEKMLSQAVTNLLANAMNYTPAGGHIRVSTMLKEKGNRHTIVISVADSGLGLNPEDRERLFDRFFRGTAAQSTGSAGTGLGMSIVKEIVDRHKGQITVESEPGHGSTFSLCLPVTQPVRTAESD